MPKSVEQICRKYEARLRAGRMGPVSEERARLQLARFRQAVEHDRALVDVTSQVLAALTVSSIEWPFYYGLVRQLDRLQRRGFSGLTLALEARLAIERWAHRGLARTVLERLCRDVLGIVPQPSVRPDRPARPGRE